MRKHVRSQKLNIIRQNKITSFNQSIGFGHTMKGNTSSGAYAQLDKVSVTGGIYNIYNILAVYATLETTGVNLDEFVRVLGENKPQTGRMEQIDLGKPFILNLAKNPAGFNQAIQTVMLDKRKKDVILAMNATANDGKDLSWLWDTEFDKLHDETLNQLYLSGVRRHDLALRFKYADIPVTKICDTMEDALHACLNTDAEVCYVLVNYSMLFPTQSTMLKLKESLNPGGESK